MAQLREPDIADGGSILDYDVYCDDCMPDADDPDAVPIYSWTETDCPLHCQRCRALIPCSLTDDGRRYVADADKRKSTPITRLWRAYFNV